VLYHLLYWLLEGKPYAYQNPLFRATIAILLGFATALLVGPSIIRFLLRRKMGDVPEFDHAALNELMRNKNNVPTMGGLIILLGILVPVLLLANLTNFYIHMALLCLLWLAVLGGFDDLLKLTAERRSGTRDGLRMWEKLIFQIGLGVVLAYFIFVYGSHNLPEGQVPYFRVLSIPFYKGDPNLNYGVALSVPAFMVVAVLVIAGTSNAVNFTDGLDGLAAGCTGLVSFAFMLLAVTVGTQSWADYLLLPHVPLTDELAIVCGAMLGACLGFLWYNCYPAQVFMGDTGSLPLGGLIGYVAIVTRQELMLLLVGAIFVIEALSVMLQVASYKMTGRRIFRVAPIHHHFHLGGWTETQVVTRFWLASAVCAAAALATIKLR